MVKKRIIMDVDPGIDDSLAILLALRSPDIKIEGFTVVSGNVDAVQGSKNLLFLLEQFATEPLNIYLGAEKPLVREFQDARDTHGNDGLGDIYNPSKMVVEEQRASDYMIEMLYKYPNEITIVALGPLMNLAEVIQKDPEALRLAESIRIMGGANKVHGNCSPVAEYNFWVDPHAAHLVFNQALENIYLYPLDVTYEIVMTPNIREMIRQFNQPLSAFIHNITGFYVDFHWEAERTLGCIINDPLVIADMIHPLVDFSKADIDIVVDGMAMAESVCNINKNGKVHIGRTVNSRKFFEFFLTTIFPEFKVDIEQQMKKELF